MNKKIKNILLGFIGVITMILLYFFGPVLLDRITGIVDRSTKGLFTDNRYSYKLNENSDILPFDIVLLPDTDISQKRVHAIVGFHYYPMMSQDATENRYYEFTDNGSLSLSNSLLLAEVIANKKEDFYLCDGSNANYALFYDYKEEETTFFYVDYQDKQHTWLYSASAGVADPIAVDEVIYWSEANELDEERYHSTLVCFNPKSGNRTNLVSRKGIVELLDANSQNLLYLHLNYEDGNDEEFLCRFNISTGTIDSVSIADIGSYVTRGTLVNNGAYLAFEDFDSEEPGWLWYISFEPNEEPIAIDIPLYEQAEYQYSRMNDKLVVFVYKKTARRTNDSMFAVVTSLETSEKIRMIENINTIGINDKYLYYVTLGLNRGGLIKNAEIVVEAINNP